MKSIWWTGRDWGQEEKGATEDEMAGWHNPLNGHEFEPDTPGSPEGNTEGPGTASSEPLLPS